ncbi:MAG: M20/M25/M40 family metallo-hydrolase [Planctomycetota bacterium]
MKAGSIRRNEQAILRHFLGYGFLACLAFLAGGSDELEQRFQSHIDYLASEQLEGRGVGSEGIRLAAEYIAREMKKAGLRPGASDSFHQSFDMTTSRELGPCGLEFGIGEGTPVKAKMGEDFIPFGFSSSDSFSGGAVFCGYGIVAEESGWDDFSKVPVEGKVAIILRGQPEVWEYHGDTNPWHKTLRNKVYNAKDRGAAAVLMVNQAPDEGEADELIPFASRGADAYGMPAMHISRKLADRLLQGGGAKSISELEAELEGFKPNSQNLGDVKLRGEVQFVQKSSATDNVIGLLKGSGPLSDEFVVIGAHYDHLGRRKPMMRKFKEGKIVEDKGGPMIHYGADDNASGTSGLIEIARILSGENLNRSVLFVAFTGEESGLHGSKHYIDHPAVPVEKTVAMLNMDMIGRLDANSRELTIFGTGSATEFDAMLEAATKGLDLTIGANASPGGRSDHAAFVRKGVPSMHFYSGAHPDYHKPTDTSDKINAGGGVQIVKLVARMAAAIANHPSTLTFVEVKPEKKEGDPDVLPTYRVVMGLAPGYVDDGKPGMQVDAVNPDGPADLGGMKSGDRIISISGKKVQNVYDYMAATRGNAAGDTVEVVVLREGKEIKLQVTLAAAR